MLLVIGETIWWRNTRKRHSNKCGQRGSRPACAFAQSDLRAPMSFKWEWKSILENNGQCSCRVIMRWCTVDVCPKTFSCVSVSRHLWWHGACIPDFFNSTPPPQTCSTKLGDEWIDALKGALALEKVVCVYNAWPCSLVPIWTGEQNIASFP